MAVGAVFLSLTASIIAALYLSAAFGLTALGMLALYVALGTLAMTTILGYGWIALKQSE